MDTVAETYSFSDHAIRRFLLKHAVAARDDVKRAYVVRKVLRNPDEPPLHVVGVQRRTRLFKLERSDADSVLINELAQSIHLADDILFITVNGNQKSFARLFKKVKGARIK